jgi:hypothetical protein
MAHVSAYTPEQIASHDSWLASLSPAEHADLLAWVYAPPDTTWIYRGAKLQLSDSPPTEDSRRFAKERRVAQQTDAKEQSKSDTLPCLRYRRCKSKRCQYCCTSKGKRKGRGIYDRTDSASIYYHLVLTLPESAHTPDAQARQLVEAFAALRRKAAWHRPMAGGIRKVEIKRNAVSQLWHCHLHAFVGGAADTTADRDAIGHRWLKLTGGAADLRRIDSAEYLRNAAYYVAKPPQQSLFGCPADLDAFSASTRGMRLYATFGNWRGVEQSREREQLTRADYLAE